MNSLRFLDPSTCLHCCKDKAAALAYGLLCPAHMQLDPVAHPGTPVF